MNWLLMPVVMGQEHDTSARKHVLSSWQDTDARCTQRMQAPHGNLSSLTPTWIVLNLADHGVDDQFNNCYP